MVWVVKENYNIPLAGRVGNNHGIGFEAPYLPRNILA
jgi:hypothetical protein